MYISTHTLTWSVTDKRILIDGGLCDFNSHAHVERDIQNAQYIKFTAISTHTLTWSVTANAIHSKSVALHFNSHAHVERDI